jgi:hypothetical protein
MSLENDFEAVPEGTTEKLERLEDKYWEQQHLIGVLHEGYLGDLIAAAVKASSDVMIFGSGAIRIGRYGITHIPFDEFSSNASDVTQ